MKQMLECEFFVNFSSMANELAVLQVRKGNIKHENLHNE